MRADETKIFRRRIFFFLPVKLFRRLELGLSGLEIFSVTFDRAEETGLVTFVARGAGLLHLNQKTVAVAVKGDVLDGLRVAAFFAFHPKFLPRAAPEMRLAGGDGAFEGSAVHPCHHHDAAGFLLLNDCGNQSLRVEFQFFVKTHTEILTANRAGNKAGICRKRYGFGGGGT
jgi:hypothetical protein